MAAPDWGVDSLTPPRADKGDFAKRVRAFAKRARRTPPLPGLELISLAVAVLATIAGAFNTGTLAFPGRIAFWVALMGWSALKWRVWFVALVRDHNDWAWAAAVGAVVLNLLLPFEIGAAMRLVGVRAQIAHPLVWLEAMAISAVVAGLIWGLRRRTAAIRTQRAAVGPLARAGIRLEHVRALRAEDHYCRVYLAEGGTRLVLARFADALAELAPFDGERIHRSAWIADAAVERAERSGRAWRLAAAGELFPVSAGNVAEARRRGWLNRR